MRTYIDTYMNAQKELVLDNYKKDSKAAYETKKNLFRIYFCSDLNSAQIDIYEINMYIHVKIIIYHTCRYIYSTEIKLKERKSMKYINLEFVFYFKIEYFFFNFAMTNNLFCF